MAQKVVAYIVRDGRIIVFRHGDDESLDESGIQVPAGTIEPGELPADAALREAHEETGLHGLRLVRYLGAAGRRSGRGRCSPTTGVDGAG